MHAQTQFNDCKWDNLYIHTIFTKKDNPHSLFLFLLSQYNIQDSHTY